MINKFIKTCKEKGDKTAFVCGKRKVSFDLLLSDVFKTVNLIKAKGLSKESRVLLFVMPSYEFYVLLFACIYYGVNVVVMDSYKNFGRIRKIMSDHGIKSVFCNRLTRIAKFNFGSDIEFINVSDYHKYSDTPESVNVDKNKIVLTTFTSGTTGNPKPIERSIKSLEKQIDIVLRNIEMNDGDIVYAGLPIYVLFVVYSGLTCVISKKIRKSELNSLGVTAVLAPIAKLLGVKAPLPFIKKVFFGGAMLCEKDAEYLRSAFPFAESTYIYGSSECVFMARSTLEHYLAHNFALKYDIDGVELSIVDQDSNGIGRIKAVGDVVLTEDREIVGSDIGYFDEYGLHIVGRIQYSSSTHYNYVEDNRLLRENTKVKKGFSFAYEGKKYFCYQGRLSNEYSDIICVRFRRLPMDPKHKTKLDYVKVINWMNI
ncbi:MAG: long-chain fatty acid--CoA ligase [Ruminococcaceae bacterium]|nr:long-chain fatty acid--CoA ligase [Oscillospiraceae bacterium]